ncbi:MAG: hypothetical protein K0R75_3438 [Paenibacillaceae bacterium]|jgi:hypothetical protein|nr:hypothetical protein [Paenibacillaceae bacterium]
MSKRKREKIKAKERRHQNRQEDGLAASAIPGTAAAKQLAGSAATASAAAFATSAAAATAGSGRTASQSKPQNKKAAAQPKLTQQPEPFAHLTSTPEWQRFYREISNSAAANR